MEREKKKSIKQKENEPQAQRGWSGAALYSKENKNKKSATKKLTIVSAEKQGKGKKKTRWSLGSALKWGTREKRGLSQKSSREEWCVYLLERKNKQRVGLCREERKRTVLLSWTMKKRGRLGEYALGKGD